MSPLTRRSRLAGLAAIASVAALAPTSSALAAPVGQLDWTFQNSFGPSGGGTTANINRTWLGYVTNPSMQGGARGTATPSAGAFGPTVTPDSVRGTNVWNSFAFTYDDTETGLASGTNTLEFSGVVSFVSVGHAFTFTVENPRVVLNTTTGTGQLFATGTTTPQSMPPQPPPSPQPYADTVAVFDLDLTKATYRVYADGSTVISCITPSIAQGGHAFPSSYATGAGPDRTPNTFGTFALRIGDSPSAPAQPAADWANTCQPKDGANGTNGTNGAAGADGEDGTNGVDGAQGPQGVAGATGPAGPVGATGPAGPAGAPGAKGENGARGKTGKRGPRGRTVVRRASLKRAAFAGTKARTVKITRRGSKAVVATGTVKGRTLTYKATKKLTGKVVLRSGGRTVTVTVK